MLLTILLIITLSPSILANTPKGVSSSNLSIASFFNPAKTDTCVVIGNPVITFPSPSHATELISLSRSAIMIGIPSFTTASLYSFSNTELPSQFTVILTLQLLVVIPVINTTPLSSTAVQFLALMYAE